MKPAADAFAFELRTHLPVVGEQHPLRRRYDRLLTRAAMVGILLHFMGFGGLLAYHLLKPERTERSRRTVVHIVEIGVPPSPTMVDATMRPAESREAPRTASRPPADAAPVVIPTDGAAGRARLQRDVAKTLTATRSTLDSTLKDLSSALSSSTGPAPEPVHRGRRRNVRSARGAGDLAAVNAGEVSTGVALDSDGSALGRSLIAVESITLTEGSSSPSSGPDGSSGPDAPVGRTTAALAAVVHRYAAGIQYCYENELKHDPRLAGKIVVAITVAASGSVVDIDVVEDTVRSASLLGCAVPQIRAWSFPAIDGGATTFRVPFVFTSPRVGP